MLEQKVWLRSGGGVLYPNLYVFLVGHPGVGKTRTIRAASSYLLEISDFHKAPTSVTAASLIDALVEAKRFVVNLPDPPLEYNTLYIGADELGTFVHKYDNEMIAVLSAFYDPDPYGHNRRGKDIKILIKKPQLNLLCGTTPSNLLNFLPEGAWEQGFTSRVLMVFSDERHVSDDFAHASRDMSKELVEDLKAINEVIGPMSVTEEYRDLVLAWRKAGENIKGAPQPSHPKLVHYNTRRRAHFYKLSMISCIDRGSVLLITRDDFNRAMAWMAEFEAYLPEIFKAGATGADGKIMDEIWHFVVTQGTAPEHKIINFARQSLPAHSVMRVLEVMERSGMLVATATDPTTGMRNWKAGVRA